MTTITLEVPDDLATRLQRDPALLQALLREVVSAKSAQVASLAMREASVPPVYQEIMDFLATGSPPEQVSTAPEQSTVLHEAQTLEGSTVLPGFTLPLQELFSELDRQGEH